VIQPSGIVGVFRPAFPALRINGLYALFVRGLLLRGDLLSVRSVRGISLAAPFVLILGVFADVSGRSSAGIDKRTRLELVANATAFFVVLGSRLLNLAERANLALEGLGTGFHNRDIIARWGDVKLGEFGER